MNYSYFFKTTLCQKFRDSSTIEVFNAKQTNIVEGGGVAMHDYCFGANLPKHFVHDQSHFHQRD